MTVSAEAKTKAAAPCPQLVSESDSKQLRKRGHYCRHYLITGAPGQCLLQRVNVRIHYARGKHTLVDYRHTYYEFFQFDGSDQSAVDVHDFHYSRDGWRQAVVNKLLTHHLPESPTARYPDARPLRELAGDPVLTVSKQFVLGVGEVQRAQPQRVVGGGAFGLLETGPTGPSQTLMELTLPGRDPVEVTSHSPLPTQLEVAGHGRFTQPRGWTTNEHLRFHYASLATTATGPTIYRDVAIPCNHTAPETTS